MRHVALIGALCTVCLTACSEDTGPNISGIPDLNIVKVKVLPSLDTMFVADTLRPTDRLQMKADVFGHGDKLIPNAAVVWASSKPEVATVTEGGLVVPTGFGTTVISASASVVGKATIVVMPAAQTVSITPALDTIFVEDPIAARDSIRLTAKALDAEGKPIVGVAFTWSSAATATATVNGAGSVTARALGVVNIAATSGTHTGTASVRVASAVKAIQATSPVPTVLAKDTVQLTAVALGYDDKPMGGRTFSWTSSNPTIATVDANGRAVFLRAGNVTFTAKSAFTTSAVTVNALERQFQYIDAGSDVTCGYTNLGRGYCWGNGTFGKLASPADSSCDGTSGNAPCTLLPKRFAGPALEFTAISVDSTNGCGITRDRLVYCWGPNNAGQLGNGNKGSGGQPTLATVAQERFDSISVGVSHVCALNSARAAFCWGSDQFGQLGDARKINSTTPIPVAGGRTYSAIAAGENHTCALSNGRAFCWGNNDVGQLGTGVVGGESDVPVAVSGAQAFVAIAAGRNHTCALTSAGNAYCWGDNTNLQAGSSGGLPIAAPASIGEGSFTRIAAGASHTCALGTAGTVSCWGSNAFGQIGSASIGGSFGRTTVQSSVPFKAIAVGSNHTCAIGTDGETYCWGSNSYGALGNELQAAFRSDPQKVATPR
jgi:alpha-tubulin suppressor-like RCC1 family protein